MAEGKDKFDINNDQKLKQDNLDKSDGPIAKTEILDGQPEHGNQSHVSEPTADGVIFPGNDTIYDTEDRADADFRPGNDPIYDTEDRADADFRPGNENFDINNDQKIAFDKSDGPIAKTEMHEGYDHAQYDKLDRDQIETLKQDNLDKSDGPGPDGVSGDVVNMADMHSHMDDAAEHQAPEGPPQNPQGMGLDRLGTQFDEDGMGDMHKPDDPNDGGEVF